jgi:endonuclease YncB( thermonuclease family)
VKIARLAVLATCTLIWAMAGWAAPAATRLQEGAVTRVGDGDSLSFAPTGQAAFELRLRDIDAPELCQPWGEQAHQALKLLALNKAATVQTAGHDKYGRTLGVLWVEGVDVGRRMVEEGHAWSLRTRWDRGPLMKQERMAKALGRGLHAQAGAVAPADFRRVHGPCTPGEATTPAAAGTAAPGPTTQRTGAPLNATFRCDGRTQCAQMSSCEEARFFLAVCPGVKMDGNRNGVPCEKQWCGSAR